MRLPAEKLPRFLQDDGYGEINFTGHRIGLHHVVRVYRDDGYSVEMIAGRFPTLPLATIHEAIAFYLKNAATVDAYIDGHDRQASKLKAAAGARPSLKTLRQRLVRTQQRKNKRAHGASIPS
jgi:uncharacterized protein (DUF433 family)